MLAMSTLTLNTTYNLTDGELAFVTELLKICGNGIEMYDGDLKAKIADLKVDQYDWFAPFEMIGDTYTKEQVGGFLSSLQSKGVCHDTADTPVNAAKYGKAYDWSFAEDFIQGLSVTPESKYNSAGGLLPKYQKVELTIKTNGLLGGEILSAVRELIKQKDDAALCELDFKVLPGVLGEPV